MCLVSTKSDKLSHDNTKPEFSPLFFKKSLEKDYRKSVFISLNPLKYHDFESLR